ncbi:MAG: GTP cyclohydrolase II RibA [Gammaproteobacteria bacterium]|nr:GTP cyclohydrolase II RibA [Gammaproteobacteria bacterium]
MDASLAAIARRGSGVLVYLRQEGRGIGLVNKLRAYRLQDAGLDTIEANLALGFPVDDRCYEPAIAMLEALAVERCVLLTNNPEKVRALEISEIEIVGVETLVLGSAPECEAYLRTKRDRMGHTIPLSEFFPTVMRLSARDARVCF